MTQRDKDNMEPDTPGDDDSELLGLDEASVKLDLGELFSHEFTNIKLFYTSPNGPVEIFTANRYGKRYILKGLKEMYSNDPIYTMSLAKEFELGMQLDHPNIRRTIGLETIEPLGRVIILEYVDGVSLRNLFDSSELTVSQGREIALQIADALRYIHSKQVYHRDLKPSNILVSHGSNAVKIIDFSLSDSGDSLILKNPSGTRRYMAPEAFDKDGKSSAVSDIYSFGIVVDEIAKATGDELLADAVRKCSVKDAEKRPQSVSYIKLPSSRISTTDILGRLLSSKLLTYILLGVIVALAAFIMYKLI